MSRAGLKERDLRRGDPTSPISILRSRVTVSLPGDTCRLDANPQMLGVALFSELHPFPSRRIRMCRTFPGKRSFVLTVAATSLAVLALAHGAAAAPARRSGTGGNYDARVVGGRGLDEVLAESFAAPLKGTLTGAQLAGQVKTMRRALERLRKTAPGASARFSPITAAPEMVSGDRGPLSAPASGRPGIDIVRDFLRANSALYGLTGADVDALHFLGESVSPNSGLRMVRVEQRLNGLPVFQS